MFKVLEICSISSNINDHYIWYRKINANQVKYMFVPGGEVL